MWWTESSSHVMYTCNNCFKGPSLTICFTSDIQGNLLDKWVKQMFVILNAVVVSLTFQSNKIISPVITTSPEVFVWGGRGHLWSFSSVENFRKLVSTSDPLLSCVSESEFRSREPELGCWEPDAIPKIMPHVNSRSPRRPGKLVCLVLDCQLHRYLSLLLQHCLKIWFQLWIPEILPPPWIEVEVKLPALLAWQCLTRVCYFLHTQNTNTLQLELPVA